MPRNVDPAQIKVGKGLAPEGTVEDTSLRYTERDVDPLRVHIHDPSRAHMASSIGIVDAGDCYVSDEVEGALQEICGAAGAGRLNGLISGGTFNELGNVANGSGSVAATTLTLETTTEIMIGPGVFDASALVASLSGLGAGVYYVYFDADSGSPTFRTLVVSGTVPEVETALGVEHVLLAKFTYDAGGNVVAWQDGRFFVRNLDRKVQYSSRQGENVDAWSEGCFATLEAFFLWMSEYGDTGTNEEEKGTVLIRGTHNIASGLTVPTDHLQFVGDGEAVLLVGNSPLDIFTLSGRTGITFRGIHFASVAAGSQGIVCTGVSTRIRVEDCTFGFHSGAAFLNGVVVTGGPASTEINISGCEVSFTSAGIVVNGVGNPSKYGAHIKDCTLVGPGASAASSIGIVLGTGTGSVDGLVSGCKIKACARGIQYGAFQRTRITSTTILDVVEGVRATGTVNDYMTISDCHIDLDDTDGLVGVNIDQTREIKVLGTYIRNPRVAFSATPFGISVTAKAGLDTDLVVQGCTILGFWDSVGNAGDGITAAGTAVNPFRRLVVDGNVFTKSRINARMCVDAAFTGNTLTSDGMSSALIILDGGSRQVVADNTMDAGTTATHGLLVTSTESAATQITATGNNIKAVTAHGVELNVTTNPIKDSVISGNSIDGFLATLTPPTAQGILLRGGDNGVPDQIVISSNHVISCKDGILVRGFNSTIRCVAVSITGNTVSFCAHDQDNHPDTFDGVGTKAIGLEFSEGCTVVGNTLSNIGQVLNGAGTPLVFANDVYALGVYGRNCEQIKVAENQIRVMQTVNNGIAAAVVFHAGSAGVTSISEYITVNDNMIYMDDANLRDRIGIGFFASDNAQTVGIRASQVAGNQITGNTDPYINRPIVFTTGNFSTAVNAQYGGNITGITVQNNTLENFQSQGIFFDQSATGNLVRANILSGIVIEGNTLVSKLTASLQSGIMCFVRGSVNFPAIVNGVQVLRNTIPRVFDSGIITNFYDEGAAGTNYTVLREVQIAGNTINDVLDSGAATTTLGIRVEVNTTGENSITEYGGIRVTDNVVQCEDIANVPTAALWVSLGPDQTFEFLEVTGNDLRATTSNANSRGVVHIENSVPNTVLGQYTSLNVSTNMIEVDASFVGTPYYALSVDLDHVNISEVRVQSNSILGKGAVSKALYLDVNNTGAANASMSRLRVSENTIRGNSVVSGSGYNLNDAAIADNTIRGANALNGTDAALEIDFQKGADPTIPLLSNFQITGNVIRGGFYGVDYLLNGVKHLNVQVDGNTLSDQGEGNNVAFGSGLRVFGTGANDVHLRNFHVDGNTISQMDGISPIIMSLSQTSGDCVLTEVSVSRNTTSGDVGSAGIGTTPYCITFNLGSLVGNTPRIEGVRIEDNQIGGAPEGADRAGVFPPKGILFTGPPEDTVVEVQNLSVSRNSAVIYLGQDEAGEGITVDLNNNHSSAAVYKNLKVDENSVVVETEGLAGDAPGVAVGIRVKATAGLLSASASRNTIKSDSTYALHYGLVFYHGFDNTTSFRTNPDSGGLEQHIVGTFPTVANVPTNSAFVAFGAADPTDGKAVTWEQLNISENVITYNAGVPGGGAETVSPRRAALTFWHTNKTASELIHVPCWGLTFSGNVVGGVRYNGTGGIFPNNILDGLFGVSLFGTTTVDGAWPNTPVGAAGSASWVSRDWTFTGNSSRGFRVYDVSAAGGRGQCVVVEEAALFSAANAGNSAQDNDAGSKQGWEEIASSVPSTGLNNNSATQNVP